MEFVIAWTVFSVIVAIIASNRGRSGFGWFCMSMLLSPLLMTLLVLALGRVKPDPSEPVAAGQEMATPETHVRCPDCRELVRRDAKKCKHCGIVLVPQ